MCPTHLNSLSAEAFTCGLHDDLSHLGGFHIFHADLAFNLVDGHQCDAVRLADLCKKRALLVLHDDM